MDTIELARRLAALGQPDEARRAYTLALETSSPEERLEAAIYIFQSGGDYRISYGCFRDLYNEGYFREDILSIMTQAFYEPNRKALKKRYEKNTKLLAKYPYIFRKDFLPFEELPVRFYPYDDIGYIPFFVKEERFGEYINFKNPVVSRNFFRDLEKPVLADGVISQYELEYLNDSVRDSKSVGRENHIYLHYGDWGMFCAYLQCWNLRLLLDSKKLVFLIADEIAQYPIDFKERFGIDYSQYAPQPVRIKEVNRLIWHTQLSAHNGGDFFNEVFDSHPNLLMMPSVMMSAVETLIEEVQTALKRSKNVREFLDAIDWRNPRIMTELYHIKSPTEKDILTAMYLGSQKVTARLDQNSRIAPALFFQPHFENIANQIKEDKTGGVVITSEADKIIHQCRIFKQFPYIKTFTPMRRITNSYAASMRFMYLVAKQNETAEEKDPNLRRLIVGDILTERVLNRSFMIDPEDRLYKDSVLVRFEDSKRNSKAAFTTLAAFLDLPYTESMTYCSDGDRIDPHGETKGFDPSVIYCTYDEYANDAERYFIEYFMRDVYEYYGYDFHYYDGAAVDETKVRELIAGFTAVNHYIRDTWWKVAGGVKIVQDDWQVADGEKERVQKELIEQLTEKHIQELDENRLRVAKLLLHDLRFVNPNGQPLRMMPMLRLDPALLEQPLYH